MVLALYVDPVDFSRPMHGSGNAAVARSAVKAMGDQFIYVGLTSHSEELGRLVEREIEGYRVSIYAIALAPVPNQVAFIPENLRFALQLVRHLTILSRWGTRALLTRTYTVMWLLALLPQYWNVCYYIPGLGNPMIVGRRPRLGLILRNLYTRIQLWALDKAEVVFAAASQKEIEIFNCALANKSRRTRVKFLPTAVDVDLFRPQCRAEAQNELNLSNYQLVLAFVGRLAAVKGIPLLFDTLSELRRRDIDTVLLLAGDGEDRTSLQSLAERQGITSHVRLLGNQPPPVVSRILAAANVFVMASFTEGFSNSMIEAVASGRPLVTTEVSGSGDLIQEGLNGFIVRDRSPQIFADRILDALALPDAEQVSRNLALERFSEQRLWQVIQESWLAPQNLG